MIYMDLDYIVQGHRFNIVSCRMAIYTSVQSILIVWALPLLMATLTCLYAGPCLKTLLRTADKLCTPSQKSLPYLTALTTPIDLQAIVQTPQGLLMMIISVWFTCRNGLRPRTSNFSHVAIFLTRFIPPYWTYFTWWIIPVSSVLYFAFFSFGEDAMKECRAWQVLFSGEIMCRSRKPISRVLVPKLSMVDIHPIKSTESAFSPQKECSASLDMSSSFLGTPLQLHPFPRTSPLPPMSYRSPRSQH